MGLQYGNLNLSAKPTKGAKKAKIKVGNRKLEIRWSLVTSAAAFYLKVRIHSRFLNLCFIAFQMTSAG
jgi:hypothetical protein